MLTDLNYKTTKEKLMAEVSFEDFYKVPNLKFDIDTISFIKKYLLETSD